MTVSTEDALGFLRMLVNSSSTVVAILAGDFGKLYFRCRVTEVTSDVLVLDDDPENLVPGDAPDQSWEISINAAVDFAYGDKREAAPKDRDELEEPFGPILGVLTIRFPGASLVIVEHAESDTET
jgi:hypothetical protein